MRNIKDHRLLYVKAVLFLLSGIIACVLILLEHPTIKTAVLLWLAIWCFARVYYFMFYVIERYIDPRFRFASLWSVMCYLCRDRSLDIGNAAARQEVQPYIDPKPEAASRAE